jgi:hypothetical protein
MQNRIFLMLFIVYVLGFCAHVVYLKQTVYGDGIYYYSWLRSAVVDRDTDFTNDYLRFNATQPVTALAVPGNKYSVGPAILWAPWFLWTHTIVRGTGYEFPYQFIVGLSGVLYAFSGLVFLFFLLNKYFSRTVSLAASIATACATNLLFYGSLDTVNSHAVSFFASVVFLMFLFQNPKRWFLIGCSLGLVALVRTQDIILGLLIIPFLNKKYIHRLFLGSLLAFLPQLVAWQLLYRKFWVSPYLSGSEGFNLLQPHIIGVLFSLQNGLALWTPVVLLGFTGLWIKRDRLPLKLMSVVFLIQLYLVACWSTWWQGASYSGRMFVSMLPLVAFGLANLFTTLQIRRFRNITLYLSIVVPLCIINLLLIIFFLLTLP